MTDDEIVAILANEIGHAKKQHILKSMPFELINFALILLLAYYLGRYHLYLQPLNLQKQIWYLG
jgi:Zn-dependent protease with chaperone function